MAEQHNRNFVRGGGGGGCGQSSGTADRIRSKIGSLRSKFPFSSSRGSSILEQALVYPLLLGVVIGAVDISRVFQGYSVLDEGMRSALRCVSPANGACINANNLTTNSLYDVYENTAPIRYRVQQHQYSGEASWLALPLHQINRVQAAVVSSVSYQVEQYQYRYQLERFRPQGKVGFAVETQSFPFVTLENAPFLSPRIQESAGSSSLATPTLRIGAPSITVRHVSRGSRQLPITRASLRFTLPRAAVLGGSETLEPNENCFLLSSDKSVDFKLPCGSSRHFKSATAAGHINQALRNMGIAPNQVTGRSETDQYAFVLIDVRGNVSSSAGAGGKVTLNISQPGGINRALGGRLISGVGAMNFVPRGGPPDFYDESISDPDAYRREVQNHQAILLKLGVEASLDFEIESDNVNDALLEWRASEVSIYTPRFEARSDIARCDSLTSRQRFATEGHATCPLSLHPAGMPRTGSLLLPGVPEQIAQEDLCMSAQNSDGNATLLARGIEEAQHYRRVSGPSSHACGNDPVIETCPVNNGVAGLNLAAFDSVKEVCGSALARSVCSIPDNVDLGRACWKIAGQNVTPKENSRWVQKSCSQSSPLKEQVPSSLKQYPEILLLSSLVSGVSEPLYTGKIEPKNYQVAHTELLCDAIKVDQRAIGRDLTELKPESLFHRTSSIGAAYKELLFSDAQHNFIQAEKNLNPEVFFTANENLSILLLDSPPSDPSQEYWIEPGNADQRKLIASKVSESQMPIRCLERPELCWRELVSVDTHGPTGPEFSPERAASIGYQAVAAAMPALASTCSAKSKSCVNLVVEQETDSTGKLFSARGEIRVPLILMPNPYIISRVSKARWERDLIDK